MFLVLDASCSDSSSNGWQCPGLGKFCLEGLGEGRQVLSPQDLEGRVRGWSVGTQGDEHSGCKREGSGREVGLLEVC